MQVRRTVNGARAMDAGNLIANTALSTVGWLSGPGRPEEKRRARAAQDSLVTLESLHSQKYRLRSGVVTSGLPHGNLTFYSIGIRSNFQGFTVYLSDMALWEDRFYPTDSPTPNYSISRDLEDLGYIAFYLLQGGVIDLENRFCLNPHDMNHWGSKAINVGLQRFIQNLIGFGESSYASAEAARRALLRLPIDREVLIEFVFFNSYHSEIIIVFFSPNIQLRSIDITFALF